MKSENHLDWEAVGVLEQKQLGSSYLVLTTDRPLHYAYNPGQYATFLLTDSLGTFRRSYSIASDPGDLKKLQFCIQIERDGRAAEIFRSATLGSQLTLSTAEGRFEVKDPSKPLVFIAGGSGIAPLKSFLHSLLPVSKSGQSGPPLLLIYGCHSVRAIPFVEEIRNWDGQFTNRFKAYFASENGQDPQIFSGNALGLLQQLRDQLPKGADYYLCGPPAMLSALRAFLADEGVSEKQIFTDSY